MDGQSDTAFDLVCPFTERPLQHIDIEVRRQRTSGRTSDSPKAAATSMSSVDLGSPATELAIEPPKVWTIPSAFSVRDTSSARSPARHPGSRAPAAHPDYSDVFRWPRLFGTSQDGLSG
jgi:hypothetical protein